MTCHSALLWWQILLLVLLGLAYAGLAVWIIVQPTPGDRHDDDGGSMYP